MNRNAQMNYPPTDLVILAGGQARRMNGINKLLQKFDEQIQLLKIYHHLNRYVSMVWVNSHRDYAIYQKIIPNIQCYQDDKEGFLGPLMGMKSAWQHVKSDYIMFIPCDVTYVPKHILATLHQALAQHSEAQVAYLSLNHSALYPFCLMKRTALATLTQDLALNQRSLRHCFAKMKPQVASIQHDALLLHSINSLDELQQYQQLKSIQMSE